MYQFKSIFFTLFLTFTSFAITGCGGEAEYSFEDLQKLSGSFINGKIEFVSKDRIYVATANSDVITVKTNSTENVTFSIVGGADGALFKIDSVTGKLSFIEKQVVGTYEVLVATEDSAGNRAIQIIDVEVVTDIKVVPPVINTTLTEYAVLDFDGIVFQIDADAADAQSALSYSVKGTDKGYFTIDSKGDVRFAEGSDTSGKTVFSIDVVVTDGYGNSTVLSGISITKVASSSDIKPVVLSQSFKIVENSLGNALIEIYKAPDATITGFTLSGGDASLFMVDSNAKLHLKTVQDFESVSKTFGFNIQVTDSHGQQSALTPVTVEIKDIDEGFHFSGVHDVAVEEGHIGAVLTISADANTITEGVEKQFSLEQGSAYFEIDAAGLISFKSAAQIDANILVLVSVESQFNGSKTLSEPFYVVVVDDPSKIAPTIDNNYPRDVTAVETQSVLLSVQATLGGDATSLTYALSGTNATLFSVDSSGNVSSNVAFDEAGSNLYTFIVEITDNNGNVVSTDTITVALLQDPNEIRPVIESTTFNITENSIENMNILITSDGNGVVDTYSIEGGADSVRFEFVSGALHFLETGADFEAQNSAVGTNSYNVTLKVTDSLGKSSDPKEIVVNVTDVDETLQFTSLNSFITIVGNTSVGVINANGKDATPVDVTYTLLDNNTIFTLDATTGLLEFINTVDVDTSYTLSIRAQSQFNGSETTSTPITVNVVPVSNAITFTEQGIAHLDQGMVIPVQIEATSASGRTLTYTMATGTDSSIFVIDATTGEMTVTVPAYIYSNDPEANIYRGAVVASDAYGNSATQQGELHVNVVDGLPVFDTVESLVVDENQKVVAQLQAHSPIGSSLVYEKVLGADGFYFSVTSDGLLTFDYAKNFEDTEDANGDNIYEVDVRVIDTLHSVNSVIKRFKVNVTDVVELGYSSFGYWSSSVFSGDRWNPADPTYDLNDNTQYEMELTANYIGEVTYSLVNNSTSGVFELSGATLIINTPNVSIFGSNYKEGVQIHVENANGNSDDYYLNIEVGS